MSKGPNRNGFTLIEALVATIIVAVGVVGVYNGMSAITRAEFRTRQHGMIQQLAQEKYDELITTEANLTAPQSGTFSDQGHSELTWNLESTPSGVENLQAITVKVQASNADAKSSEGVASGLVYIHPETTSAGTTP